MKHRLIITLAWLGFSAAAMAGDRAFSCTVKNVYKLNSNGAIEAEKGPAVPRVGDDFSVDRKTGVVVGERIPTFRPDTFTVLSPGDGNAFTLSYSARTRASFLRIESYHNSQLVPFVLLDGIFIASGTCK